MRSRLLGVAGLAGALMGGTGCYSPPPEAVARLEEVKQQGAALEQAAEGLEERFLGNQEKVHLWSELRERHQHVSAIVVRNHSSHFDDMVRLFDAQQEKARKLHRNFASTGDYVSTAAVAPKKAGLNAR
jgi:hypothetical protein